MAASERNNCRKIEFFNFTGFCSELISLKLMSDDVSQWDLHIGLQFYMIRLFTRTTGPNSYYSKRLFGEDDVGWKRRGGLLDASWWEEHFCHNNFSIRPFPRTTRPNSSYSKMTIRWRWTPISKIPTASCSQHKVTLPMLKFQHHLAKGLGCSRESPISET